MADSRQVYQSKYHKQNKEKHSKKNKKYYEDHKEKILTKRRSHYKLYRDIILSKRRAQTMDQLFRHIHPCINKYAGKWKIPCESFDKFEEWSYKDETFKRLYEEWKATDYDPLYRPVVMRSIKKTGFVQENLTWDIRKNYSWWNEDAVIYAEVEKETEDQQRVRNKRDKEWRKKVYQDQKAKQKARKEKNK